MQMAVVKYKADRLERVTAAKFAALQAKPVQKTGEVTALLLQGPCPRCCHPTSETVPVAVVTEDVPADALEGGAGAGGAEPMTHEWTPEPVPEVLAKPSKLPIVMACRCAHDHGGNEGKFGCGRSWMVVATFHGGDASIPVSLAPPTEDQLASWADALALKTTDFLEPTRKAADLWQKALTAIVGTVGIVAALGGRDGIGKLAEPWRDWATALTIAFLVLTAIAAFWAHQAAIGLPTFKVVRDATELAAWTADPTAKTRNAVRRIRHAITLSLIAFVLGLVALAIIWRAPSASTPGPMVEVTATSEDIICGELLAAGDDDEVRVRNDEGAVVTVPAGQVETITPKAAC